MTQPPGWPPQGGYGAPQQPQQPPYPGPYAPQPPAQAPGQVPGQVPNPYAAQPAYGGGQYGAYPPPPPESGGRNKRKPALVVAGAVAAVALIGGGIYLATSDGGSNGNNKPLAHVSESVDPSASSSPTDATEGPEDPSEEESSPASDDATATAPATGFQGQWQDDDNKTLTIGEEYTAGDYKGKHPLSYIDAGGKGILTGLGVDRGDGTFRLVLSPMSTKSAKEDDYVAATLTRSGGSVDIEWDDGGSDTLAYVGE
ncbi:hypothetical protein [Streptomyces sp. NPDC051636]|uniref:hypothetical protein n=1 Tax=Streptomyces sp. NPDC051636 TaxID=3365663 RepID=UPI00379C330F